MNSLFSYIITFGIFLLFLIFLPYLFPILLVLLLIFLLFIWRIKRNVQTFTFPNMDDESEPEENNLKEDVIDVEYTETEEDCDD